MDQILLRKVRQSIEQEKLLYPGQSVLVGISGGPDSVFLTYILKELGFQVSMAHVNYSLRGKDSDEDEKLVRRYSSLWNLPLFVLGQHPEAVMKKEKFSLQEAARKIRYDFFDSCMEEDGISACATGHHAGDQVETILYSFLKGEPGGEVLKGIPVRRNRFVRPLIHISREEILEFLKNEGIEYRIDLSNEKNDYQRNQIRNLILPELRKLNPSVGNQILTKYHIYSEETALLQILLEPHIQKALKKEGGNEILHWKTFSAEFGDHFLPLLVRRVCEKWEIRGNFKREVVKLVDSISGKWVDTPEGRVFRVKEGILLETKAKTYSVDLPIRLEEAPNEMISFFDTIVVKPWIGNPDWSLPNTHFLDLTKIQWPITFRNWKNGDRMRPMGMKNWKKLSDIFIDEKFNPIQKEQAIIVEDQEQILCLQGFRIAEEVKITSETRQILCISFS